MLISRPQTGITNLPHLSADIVQRLGFLSGDSLYLVET